MRDGNTGGSMMVDLTPAEAVGWQIIDTLDEETRAKLYELMRDCQGGDK